ncbi:unnamed protein product [Amoebophrya sp. A25]|nr:unnamed protein product [Amoebophrya sp. A25]|eukprot:GSA25T00010255001.1
MSSTISPLAGLTGKVAIITGAASGIGRATAKAFATVGTSVILVDVDETGLQETEKEVLVVLDERFGSFPVGVEDGGRGAAAGNSASPATVVSCVVDVSSPKAIRDFADDLANRGKEHSRVDILINNAGVGIFCPVVGGDLILKDNGNAGVHKQEEKEDTTWENQWRQCLDVNLMAQARLARALIRRGVLVTSRAGASTSSSPIEDHEDEKQPATCNSSSPSSHSSPRAPSTPCTSVIINVTSTEAHAATLNNAAYVTSKHAAIGLTRALAVELAQWGVRVNSVDPGSTRTGITAAIPERLKEVHAQRLVPLRRYAEPSEVANAIVALCLPSLSYVTGASLLVDGGHIANNALLPSGNRVKILKRSKL